MKTGDAIEFTARPPVTREQLAAYAAASGDFNPIHLDEEVAKKNGLPGIIAHGMLTAAFIAERAHEVSLGLIRQSRPWKLEKLQVRFKAMTHLGDVVSVGGSIKLLSEAEAVMDLVAKNQKGEITTTGQARFS